MLKTTSELQEFILWAKKERVKTFKVAGVEVEFSDLAFIDAISELEPEYSPQATKTEERNTSKTMVDTLSTEEEDEELLFFSAKP